MITGTSVLMYEQQRQVTTPITRATIRSGLMRTINPSFTNLIDTGDAIFWNNRHIIYGASEHAGNTMATFIQSYTSDGASRISTTRIETITLADTTPDAGGFLNTGNTLDFFYAVGSTPWIYRQSSINGDSWGATTGLIGISDTEHFTVCDMVVLGSTDIYLLTDFFGASEDSLSKAIKRVIHTGSAWGITTILRFNDFNDSLSDITQGRWMVGISTENEARLLLKHQGVSQGSDGLRLIRTDGFNIIGSRDILPTNTIDQSGSRISNMVMGNLAKGVTAYYLVVTFNQLDSTNLSTTAASIANYTNGNVMRSVDFLNWSMPVSTGITSTVLTDSMSHFLFSRPRDGVEVSFVGSSIFSGAYSTNGQWVEILGSSEYIDISGDLINYSNSNNDVINIRVGNLK